MEGAAEACSCCPAFKNLGKSIYIWFLACQRRSQAIAQRHSKYCMQLVCGWYAVGMRLVCGWYAGGNAFTYDRGCAELPFLSEHASKQQHTATRSKAATANTDKRKDGATHAHPTKEPRTLTQCTAHAQTTTKPMTMHRASNAHARSNI